MSSSNRAIPECEAVVYCQRQPSGPVRLPDSHSSDFIAEFNRIYGTHGMQIEPVPSSDQSDRLDRSDQ